MKKALITGITGWNGSFLAELLLEKGSEIHGIKRRASSCKTCLNLPCGDVSDTSNLARKITGGLADIGQGLSLVWAASTACETGFMPKMTRACSA